MSSWIALNASRLADCMLSLAQWNKKSPLRERYASTTNTPGLIKLPPVFLGEPGGKYGDGRRNLIAIIIALADYEDGVTGEPPLTLADLPARYNFHGGAPDLSERDLRRVHNWLQQVSFGLRAAVMAVEEEQSSGLERTDVPDRVLRRLYSEPSSSRRAFVTYAPDSLYEFKPLRHAPDEAIRRWLQQEWMQRRSMAQGKPFTGTYGAQPTAREWESYGSRGQNRNLIIAVTSQVESMLQIVRELDETEHWQQADQVDEALYAMAHHLRHANSLTV